MYIYIYIMYIYILYVLYICVMCISPFQRGPLCNRGAENDVLATPSWAEGVQK